MRDNLRLALDADFYFYLQPFYVIGSKPKVSFFLLLLMYIVVWNFGSHIKIHCSASMLLLFNRKHASFLVVQIVSRTSRTEGVAARY